METSLPWVLTRLCNPLVTSVARSAFRVSVRPLTLALRVRPAGGLQSACHLPCNARMSGYSIFPEGLPTNPVGLEFRQFSFTLGQPGCRASWSLMLGLTRLFPACYSPPESFGRR